MSNNLAETRPFLDAMIPVLETAERTEAVLRRRLGTAFRISEYAADREVSLNRVIGDLLDPRGPHGQGGMFLEKFLDEAGLGVLAGDSQQWNVITNYPTRRTRHADPTKQRGYVDLALFRGPEVAIYVESKPWAAEGEKQLDDYVSDLLTLRHKHKRFVFLPGTWDRQEYTLSPGIQKQLGERYIRIAFQYSKENPSIVRWLERCAAACEADNVRIFVNDLAEYLRTQFPSPETRPMSDDPFSSTMMPIVQGNKSYMDIVLRL